VATLGRALRKTTSRCFSILAGSSVSTLWFDGTEESRISYRRVRGTRAEKFETLRDQQPPEALLRMAQ
jgi:hypothetical protein